MPEGDTACDQQALPTKNSLYTIIDTHFTNLLTAFSELYCSFGNQNTKENPNTLPDVCYAIIFTSFSFFSDDQQFLRLHFGNIMLGAFVIDVMPVDQFSYNSQFDPF